MTTTVDFGAPSDRGLLFDYGETRFVDAPANTGGPEWEAVLSAFEDYAANRNLETVVLQCAAAATKCQRWSRQTVGLALGAATQNKLGNRDIAQQLLQQAEEKWKELEENNPDDRGFGWADLTLAELALDEARRQVGTTNVAGK